MATTTATTTTTTTKMMVVSVAASEAALREAAAIKRATPMRSRGPKSDRAMGLFAQQRVERALATPPAESLRWPRPTGDREQKQAAGVETTQFAAHRETECASPTPHPTVTPAEAVEVDASEGEAAASEGEVEAAAPEIPRRKWWQRRRWRSTLSASWSQPWVLPSTCIDSFSGAAAAASAHEMRWLRRWQTTARAVMAAVVAAVEQGRSSGVEADVAVVATTSTNLAGARCRCLRVAT
jgi:hypothetical protein